jgi:hypothetical protein
MDSLAIPIEHMSNSTTNHLLKVLDEKIEAGSLIPVNLQAALIAEGIDVEAIINRTTSFHEDFINYEYDKDT